MNADSPPGLFVDLAFRNRFSLALRKLKHPCFMSRIFAFVEKYLIVQMQFRRSIQDFEE